MVLAEAFMKRNDIKKQISKLTAAAAQNLWQDKALPINFSKGTKVNPSEAYSYAIELMVELQLLNTAIATANVANNKLLRELETTTAEIAFAEQVLAMAENYPGDKVKERNYGEGTTTIIENEWLIDPQALKLDLADLQSHKRDLEKTLAHNNFTITI